jgi:fimbrial isopeptide formation D2 family protein
MSKKAYEDDSRNRSGFYYIEKEITDSSTVQNGNTIVYNVVTKNAGGNSAPDTTITDRLSSNLTYVDGDSGCTYDSATRVVTCVIGALSPNSEAQRSFRAKVTATGTVSIANTAEVTSTNGQRDSCSINIDATGKVITTVASPIPTALPVAGVFEVTVGTLGVGLLLLILGGLGLLLI